MTKEQIIQIIKEKVDGVWVACHDEKGHHYKHTPTGVVVDSVTTKIGTVVNKPHLNSWAVKMGLEWLLLGDRLEKLKDIKTKDEMVQGAILAHTDYRDSMGSTGSIAHEAIEDWLNAEMKGDITEYSKGTNDYMAIAAMRSAQKLFIDKNITPIWSELLVGNVKYSAGTLDLLCLWGNDLCLVDWKSSNNVSQEYILQVVAYKKFFEEMTGLKIKKVKILHLSKSYDKYDIYDVTRFSEAYKAFKHCCGLYDWKVDYRNKLVKDVKRIKL